MIFQNQALRKSKMNKNFDCFRSDIARGRSLYSYVFNEMHCQVSVIFNVFWRINPMDSLEILFINAGWIFILFLQSRKCIMCINTKKNWYQGKLNNQINRKWPIIEKSRLECHNQFTLHRRILVNNICVKFEIYIV